MNTVFNFFAQDEASRRARRANPTPGALDAAACSRGRSFGFLRASRTAASLVFRRGCSEAESDILGVKLMHNMYLLPFHRRRRTPSTSSTTARWSGRSTGRGASSSSGSSAGPATLGVTREGVRSASASAASASSRRSSSSGTTSRATASSGTGCASARPLRKHLPTDATPRPLLLSREQHGDARRQPHGISAHHAVPRLALTCCPGTRRPDFSPVCACPAMAHPILPSRPPFSSAAFASTGAVHQLGGHPPGLDRRGADPAPVPHQAQVRRRGADTPPRGCVTATPTPSPTPC